MSIVLPPRLEREKQRWRNEHLKAPESRPDHQRLVAVQVGQHLRRPVERRGPHVDDLDGCVAELEAGGFRPRPVVDTGMGRYGFFPQDVLEVARRVQASGRLELEGNSKTRDKVIRREIRVQEGKILNMAALQSSLFKIQVG